MRWRCSGVGRARDRSWGPRGWGRQSRATASNANPGSPAKMDNNKNILEYIIAQMMLHFYVGRQPMSTNGNRQVIGSHTRCLSCHWWLVTIGCNDQRESAISFRLLRRYRMTHRESDHICWPWFRRSTALPACQFCQICRCPCRIR